MYAKIFLIATAFAVVDVQAQSSHGHGHEPAYSSQNIHRHDGHVQEIKIKDKHGYEHIDYIAYPKYDYEYKLEDKHTGDLKSQHETRDGDVVKGHYTLHDADGTVRIVHYTADKKNGFNAEVKREGHAKHIEPIHHH